MTRDNDAGNLKAGVVSWVNDLHRPSTPSLRTNFKDEQDL